MTKALHTAQARVTGGRANGHGRTSDGALEVDLRLPQELVELVRAAHEVCPYSNATRNNIDVSLTANGQSVD